MLKSVDSIRRIVREDEDSTRRSMLYLAEATVTLLEELQLQVSYCCYLVSSVHRRLLTGRYVAFKRALSDRYQDSWKGYSRFRRDSI